MKREEHTVTQIQTDEKKIKDKIIIWIEEDTINKVHTENSMVTDNTDDHLTETNLTTIIKNADHPTIIRNDMMTNTHRYKWNRICQKRGGTVREK